MWKILKVKRVKFIFYKREFFVMSEHMAQEDPYKVAGTFGGVVTITTIWLRLRNNAEWLTALLAQKQETNISVTYSGDTRDVSSLLI